MKKFVFVVLLLVLTMSACTAFALTTAEKEEMYNSAVTELEAYLDARESRTDVLIGIREQFAAVKHSYSQQLEYYADVLIMVEEGNFSWKYAFNIQAMENANGFPTYLEEIDGSIGSLEELKNYAEARRAEKEGRNEEAAALYSACSGFFDSSDRWMNIVEDRYETLYRQGLALMDANKYEEAYSKFIQCPGYEDSDTILAFIVGVLGYDPVRCDGNHQFITIEIEAATCMSEGKAEITCTVCGMQETTTTKKDSSKHTGKTEVKNKKAATCGEEGYSGDVYCLDCGEKISVGKKTNATGDHKYTETVIQTATCAREGKVNKTCTVCGKQETTTTKKDSSKHTGKTEVRNKKAATCGKDGYSGDTYCVACDKKIKSGTKINATGNHQWKSATYNAPMTCKVCGKTEGKALSRIYKKGECFTFGHYPQKSSGTDKTAITWMVLDVNQNQNKVLVISKYALDCQPYNTTDESVIWDTCTLRVWLNNTFMKNAFTVQEQQAILLTYVDNSKSQGYPANEAALEKAKSYRHKDTPDKVFLLSYDEAWRYFINDEERMCESTAYARKRKAYKGTNNGKTWWWLRSPGTSLSSACRVDNNGGLKRNNVDTKVIAVRPAMWLDLSSGIF